MLFILGVAFRSADYKIKKCRVNFSKDNNASCILPTKKLRCWLTFNDYSFSNCPKNKHFGLETQYLFVSGTGQAQIFFIENTETVIAIYEQRSEVGTRVVHNWVLKLAQLDHYHENLHLHVGMR